MVRETPPGEPDARAWSAHIRLGTGMSWAVIGMIAVYLTLRPDHPNGHLLWPALGLAALVTLAITRTPWQRLMARGLLLPVVVGWSLSLVVLTVVLTLLDGGAGSPMAKVIVLPLVFAAMLYPVRATVAVGVAVVGAQLVLAWTSDSFDPGRMVLETLVLTLIAVMATLIARNHGDTVARAERLAERLRELAHVDGLTGCLNHRGFREQLDTEVARAKELGAPVALLHADLDHFKRVNDTYGHPVGDQVLAAVGATLRDLARDGDAAGRVGGEEFVLLLPGAGLADADAVAERLRHAVSALDAPVAVTISVGVSALPAVASSAESLVETADRALYAAKRAGRDRVVVAADGVAAAEPSSSAAASTRLSTVFQPVVDLRTGAIHAHEALARIVGSELGPDRWLAVAEVEGRRHDLELAMLDVAIGAYRDLARPMGARLFLNLSADLLPTDALWQRRGALPAGTVFEVSEQHLSASTEPIIAAAHRWMEEGVELAVDDLGVGHANLRAVLDLRPRYLKLDRSLVGAIQTAPWQAALVRSLLVFADEVGAVVIAEGAETGAELQALAGLGVPLAQGYGLARPGNPPPEVAWPEAAALAAVAILGPSAVVRHDA